MVTTESAGAVVGSMPRRELVRTDTTTDEQDPYPIPSTLQLQGRLPVSGGVGGSLGSTRRAQA